MSHIAPPIVVARHELIGLALIRNINNIQRRYKLIANNLIGFLGPGQITANKTGLEDIVTVAHVCNGLLKQFRLYAFIDLVSEAYGVLFRFRA